MSDIVMYEIATRKVISIAGTNLTDKGFHTIDRRIETVLAHINTDLYDVQAVPAGSLKVGDILPKG